MGKMMIFFVSKIKWNGENDSRKFIFSISGRQTVWLVGLMDFMCISMLCESYQCLVSRDDPFTLFVQEMSLNYTHQIQICRLKWHICATVWHFSIIFADIRSWNDKINGTKDCICWREWVLLDKFIRSDRVFLYHVLVDDVSYLY